MSNQGCPTCFGIGAALGFCCFYCSQLTGNAFTLRPAEPATVPVTRPEVVDNRGAPLEPGADSRHHPASGKSAKCVSQSFTPLPWSQRRAATISYEDCSSRAKRIILDVVLAALRRLRGATDTEAFMTTWEVVPGRGIDMQLSPLGTRSLRFMAILAAMLAIAACSNTPKPEDQLNGGLGANTKGPATPGSARDFSQNVGDIVYFSTDQTDLTPEAQQTLSNQARWLQQYAQYSITIEGHADERGTREYNIGLGSKRAESVRSFLARNGIAAARIRTISYGKERPVAVCNDISCWSQNRRAQTVLNNRGGGVAKAN